MPMTIQQVEKDKHKKGHNEKIECKSMEKLENELEAKSLIPSEEDTRLAKENEDKVKETTIKKLIDKLDKKKHPYSLANLQRHFKSEVSSEKTKEYEESIEIQFRSENKELSIEALIKKFDNLPHQYNTKKIYTEDKRPEVTATSKQDEECTIKPTKNTSNLHRKQSFFGDESKTDFEAALQTQRKNLKPLLNGPTKSILFNNPIPLSPTDEQQPTPTLAIRRK